MNRRIAKKLLSRVMRNCATEAQARRVNWVKMHPSTALVIGDRYYVGRFWATEEVGRNGYYFLNSNFGWGRYEPPSE